MNPKWVFALVHFRDVEPRSDRHGSPRKPESILQLQNAASYSQTSLEFGRLERLGDVVVGAGFHGGEQIFARGLGGKDQNVGVVEIIAGANAPAHFDAVQTRHQPVEDRQPGTFLISSGEKYPPVALRVDPPLVVLRVHIGDVPKREPTGLFRKLLQLNAKALVHASYGIDEERIILSSALELENLDFNELEATLDEIDLALAQHVPLLSELSKQTTQ